MRFPGRRFGSQDRVLSFKSRFPEVERSITVGALLPPVPYRLFFVG